MAIKFSEVFNALEYVIRIAHLSVLEELCPLADDVNYYVKDGAKNTTLTTSALSCVNVNLY